MAQISHKAKIKLARKLRSRIERKRFRAGRGAPKHGTPLFESMGWGGRAGSRETAARKRAEEAHLRGLVRRGIELTKEQRKAHIALLKHADGREGRRVQAEADRERGRKNRRQAAK